MTTVAPAATRKLTTISYGASSDHTPAAISSPVIENHLAAFSRVALARRSDARPLATHACHTTSLSCFAGGCTHAFGCPNVLEVDMSNPFRTYSAPRRSSGGGQPRAGRTGAGSPGRLESRTMTMPWAFCQHVARDAFIRRRHDFRNHWGGFTETPDFWAIKGAI